MGELITWACVVVALNSLDSATTYIGLQKLPTPLRGKEGNPLLAFLMARRPLVAHLLKNLVVIGVAIAAVYFEERSGLMFAAAAFSLVVLNNLYLIVVKLLTKKRHFSPIYRLSKWFGVPEILSYPFALATILGTAWGITWLLGGV